MPAGRGRHARAHPAANGPAGQGGIKSAAEAPHASQHNTSGAETWAMKKQTTPEISRARRLQITSPAIRHPGQFAGSNATSATGRASRPQTAGTEVETTKQPASTRKLDELKANKDRSNNLKVLFVLTPDDTPASSPPPEKNAKVGE